MCEDAVLSNMLNDDFVIQFWGVRGNLPVPGLETIRYGGNTCCTTLYIANKHRFIFDAGSGIKRFAEYLTESKIKPFSAKLFISHPHWDHINALPYFDPLYVKGNELEILIGNDQNIPVEQLVFGQMHKPHFPITVKELSAKLIFRQLQEESFEIDDINVQTIRLNHPGFCLGYRIQYREKSFCYITDNELPLRNSPNFSQTQEDALVQFIDKADVLLIDTAYSDEEYKMRIGWGHACVSQVVDIADRANVKRLCLYHHCPHQKDNDIDLKLSTAQSLLKSKHSKTECLAPREGEVLTIR